MSTVKKIFAYIFLFTIFLGIMIVLGCERSDHWKQLLFWGTVTILVSTFAIHTILHTSHVLRHLFALYAIILVAAFKIGIRNDATDMAYELYSEIDNLAKFYVYLCNRYYAEKVNGEYLD